MEDAGGYCLLGHRLTAAFDPPPPPPPPPAMDDLTAEVDSVFGAARAAVRAMAQTPEPESPALPASRYASSLDRTWAELESAPPPAADDPINSFAPPPRMDWGPRRAAGRFRFRRDRVEASV
ncbi:MAG: hypothetical protein ABR613_13025 [Actinomycetota bacterium]